jgi:hypothetical protein
MPVTVPLLISNSVKLLTTYEQILWVTVAVR